MSTFVFSLGLIPVQEWIEEARRSRDLRAGSVFLCHTMACVLRLLGKVVKSNGGEAKIWLPEEPEEGYVEKLAGSFRQALTLDYGIPNRASGWLEAESGKAVRKIFAQLEEEVRNSWAGLENEYLDERSGGREAAEFWQQLRQYLEEHRAGALGGRDCPLSLVWVAQRVHLVEKQRPRAEDYLGRIDRLYVEVKRTRPIPAWPDGTRVGKCNQCGKREAIGPWNSYHKWHDWHRKVSELPWVAEGVRLDPGERLCYVCLTRRLAGYAQGGRFRSTGEVAMGPWRDTVMSLGLESLIRDIESTKVGRSDAGRAFYLSEQKLREMKEKAPDSGASQVLAARKELREGIAKKRTADRPVAVEPPGYLALLTFDGDSMGEWVGKMPETIPGQLNDFARLAKGILEEPLGKRPLAEIFYLAGDEGLVMAPAAEALRLALKVREAFSETFGTDEEAPTLSMSVVFFEQSRPMAGAIRAAHALLREAKACDGKNALAVGVETASGSRWSYVDHWGEAWERLTGAVELVLNGKLAAGWAHDVERFLETLPPEAWRPDSLEAIRGEVRRLLFRRLKPCGESPEERLAHRWRIWRDPLKGERWWSAEVGELQEMAPQQLHLVAFLARQGAETPTSEEG